MDQDRARSLLIAERDEVLRACSRTPSRRARTTARRRWTGEAEDNADAAQPLTEEGKDDAIAESLREPAGGHRAGAAPAG